MSISIVDSENFDELMGALERQLDFPSPLDEHVRASKRAARVSPWRYRPSMRRSFPHLRVCQGCRSSLFRRRLAVSVFGKSPQHPTYREYLKKADIRGRAVIAATGDGAVVFGRDAEIMKALDPLEQNTRRDGHATP